MYFFPSLLCVLDAAGEPFLVFLVWKSLHYGCGDRTFPGFFSLCFALLSFLLALFVVQFGGLVSPWRSRHDPRV